MDQTNQELHDIITDYGLTRREVSNMMMCNKPTVDRYLTPPRKGRCANPTYRRMPAFRLKLLLDEIRLQGRKRVLDDASAGST